MSSIQIVEVAPRDGFQPIVPFIPTESKVEFCNVLLEAGVSRLEAGAFVSPKAIPQMADVVQVLEHIKNPSYARLSVLVPNSKGGLMALDAGVKDIVFVFSISESHNQSNVGRSVAKSLEDFATLIHSATTQFKLRLNLATCFDCPFEGSIDAEQVVRIVEKVLAITPDVEFGICDTTGRAFPDQVRLLMGRLISGYASERVSFAFHGHDTYGMGLANALAAYEVGTRIFDSATGGLGGCPFAPGATGNTATEDLVFAFENMGIHTGISLEMLLKVADSIVTIPGATIGGHVRKLPRARVLSDKPAKQSINCF